MVQTKPLPRLAWPIRRPAPPPLDIQVGYKVADLIKAIPESVYAAIGEKIAAPKPYGSFSASFRIFIVPFPIIS